MLHEQRFYREPLLVTLALRGGSAVRPVVLDAMSEMLSDVLTDEDRIPLDKRGSEEGWRNRTSWEVKILKEEGLLQPTTVAGRGIWSLSDSGRHRVREVQRASPGVRYTTPVAPNRLNTIQPFDVDPDLVDRGRFAHYLTVDRLAHWLGDSGIVPLLPTPIEPRYDLAWLDGDIMNVAEVKSITDENEERQLRLGLGQVLRYQHLLMANHRIVLAWLIPERKPMDQTWLTMCSKLGVRLSYPPSFDVDVLQ